MDVNALQKLSYGLYVTGVETPNGFGGSVVDSLSQVSGGEPLRVALGSMNRNYTTEAIRESGELTVSVLGQDFDPFAIANFGFRSARDPEVRKWDEVRHTIKDGLPVLNGAISHMRLSVEHHIEYDTHTLFICTVSDAWLGESAAKPLLYADYQEGRKEEVFTAFAEWKKQREKS